MSAASSLPPPSVPFNLDTANYASIYTRGSRPALELPQSFAFLLNAGQLADSLPPIAPDHVLRKATSEEVAAIKDVLAPYTGGTDWGAWQCGKQTKRGDTTSRPPLPEDQWRYFIISFERSNNIVVQVERALCIARYELQIGFTLLNGVFPRTVCPILIYNPGRLFAQTRRVMASKLRFISIGASTISDIATTSEQLAAFGGSPFNVQRLILQLLDLEALPHDSRMLFLGYFAILEALLTHQPRKDDTIDSLTRQVKQKVLLLDKRWQPHLDYSRFPETTPERIWGKMYAYRSSLAHGGEPDFQDALKLLVAHDAALELIRETVKAVMRQMLAEPQLLLDLRNC